MSETLVDIYEIIMGPKKTPSRRDTQTPKRDLASPDETNDAKKGKMAAGSPNPLNSEDEMITEIAEKPLTNIVMSHADLEVIGQQLTDTFQSKIELMVKSIADLVIPEIVKGVTTRLEKRVSALESENDSLRKRINQLENSLDSAEQYSRRNNLRISGLPETQNESTDDLVLAMSSAIGADMSIDDIDRSHRVGAKNNKSGETNSSSRPRDIIVKFVSYRSRDKFFRKRRGARSSGYNNVYVDEDLTRNRSLTLFKCRELKRQGRIQDAWTSDGKILVKDRSGKIRSITPDGDLSAFH